MHPRFDVRRSAARMATAGFAALAVLLAALAARPAATASLVETPMFTGAVAAGELPSVDRRLPERPHIVALNGYKSPGRHGGELNMLVGRAKDVRLLVVYGYARLIGYNERFELEPDILDSVDIEEGRIFHAQASQRAPLVGRPSLHGRGFSILLGGCRQQFHPVPLGPAARLARRWRNAPLRGA